MTDKPRLLYILAPSYSGSTLLTYLLARHPRIATIGELKATKMGDVDRYRCSCGQLIVDCGFWSRVADVCRERGIPFDVHDFGTALGVASPIGDRLIRATVRGPLIERLRSALLAVAPATRRRLSAQIARNCELSRIITELQGADIFLDGSKDAARLLHFVGAGLWDVRVVYLQRDGRGVTASIAKHDGVAFDRAAERWARNMRGLESMRARLPGQAVFDMKYEELCREPEAVLGRLFTWLGIDPVAVQTGNFKEGDFHILGNMMRLNAISDIRLDEKWRASLDDGQKALFARRFGRLHRQLGYS